MRKAIFYYKVLLCAFGLMTALAGQAALAGSISQQIHTTCTVTDKGVIVKVTTTNIGREAAVNVQILVLFQGKKHSSQIKPTLEPGAYFTAMASLRPDLKMAGSYSVEVRVNFHDQNGYPFSSLSHGSFVFKEGVNTEVFIEPSEVILAKRSKLELEIFNMDQESREIKIRLAVPRELNVTPSEKILTLKARGKRKVHFTLENFSALPGSVYPILGFLEYEADGRHFSGVSESKVNVIAGENIFRERRWLFLIFGIVLGVIAILSQVFRRKGEAEK
jgi:hypothetical protein